MNKTLAILSALATSAAFAVTTVESSNEFGFVPVTGISGLKAISVPVAGYTVGTDPTDIKIAEVLQTTGLKNGDKLYTLGSDGKYNEYTLLEGTDSDTWTPSRIVTVGADGTLSAVGGTPAEEATLKRGQAFWLQTSATSVNLLGQVPTGEGSISISEGWNLIGNPSMTEPLLISSITDVGKGSLLDVGGKVYQYTTSGQNTTSGWKRHSDRKPVEDSDAIPVGQGAMLYRK